ncbi:MAG: DUF4836 family protein, partial [Bacteroidota bacterium]
VALADEAAFAKLIDAAGLDTPENIEGYNYIAIDRNAAVAWNSETALLLISSGYANDLEKSFRQILTASAEESVATDKDLMRTFSQNHDINSWVSTNPIANNKNLSFYLSMINMEKEDLQDNYVHSHMNFEKGVVTGQSDYVLSEKLEKEFGLFIKSGVGTKFDQLIPGNELIYSTSLALNADGLLQFAEKSNTKGFIDFALMEYGMKLQDLSAMLDGDLSISAYKGAGDRDADGLVLIKIKDMAKLSQVLQLAEEYEMLSKIGDQRYSMSFGSAAANNFSNPFGGKSRLKTEGELLIKDGIVYISSSSKIIGDIESGDFTSASKTNWGKDLLRNNSFSTFVDFNNIDPLQEAIPGDHMDQLRIKSENGTTDLELTMKNGSINSLKALMQMIND